MEGRGGGGGGGVTPEQTWGTVEQLFLIVTNATIYTSGKKYEEVCFTYTLGKGYRNVKVRRD